MKANSILTVSLLSPAWKVAFVLFPLLIILVSGMVLVQMDITPNESAEIMVFG